MKPKSTSTESNAATCTTHVPSALASVLFDRVYISTHEFAKLVNCKPHSIWNCYSEKGDYHGIKPVKLGGRLLWPTDRIAVVLAQ
jgi:hypothetical protein